MPAAGAGGTSNNVYVRSDDYAWIPARLVKQGNGEAKVAIPQYASEEQIMSDGGKAAVGFKSAVVKLKDYPNGTLPLQNTTANGTLKEVDDMVDLPYLHEVSHFLFFIFALVTSNLNIVFQCFFGTGCNFVQLETSSRES